MIENTASVKNGKIILDPFWVVDLGGKRNLVAFSELKRGRDRAGSVKTELETPIPDPDEGETLSRGECKIVAALLCSCCCCTLNRCALDNALISNCFEILYEINCSARASTSIKSDGRSAQADPTRPTCVANQSWKTD